MKMATYLVDDSRLFTLIFLVDRDGNYFEPILNYLRTGQMIVPANIPKEAILIEAEFYSVSN